MRQFQRISIDIYKYILTFSGNVLFLVQIGVVFPAHIALRNIQIQTLRPTQSAEVGFAVAEAPHKPLQSFKQGDGRYLPDQGCNASRIARRGRWLIPVTYGQTARKGSQ